MKQEVKNIFRKQFDEFESEVDTTRLLKEIRNKRQPKKENRFWIIFPVGLLILGYAVLIIRNGHTNTLRSSDNVQMISSVVDFQNKKNNSQLAMSSTNYIENTKKSTQPKDQEKDLSSTNKDVPNSKFKAKSILKNKQSLITDTRTDLRSKVLSERSLAFINNKDQTSFNSNSKTIASQDEIGIARQQLTLIDGIIQIELADINSKINYLKIEERDVELDFLRDIVTHDLDKKRDNNKRLSILAFSGTGISNTTLATKSPKYTQVALDETASINHYSSVSANLYFSYAFSERFSMASGLSYQRTKELFSWSKCYITNLDGQLVGYIDNKQEVNNLIQDSGSTEFSYLQVDRNIKNYNELSYLDLPVAGSYNIILNPIRISFDLGYSFNLNKSFSGFGLNEDTIPVEIPDSSDRFSGGNQCIGGLSVGIAIGNHIDLLSGFRFSSRKMHNDNLTKRDHTYWLNLGVAYRM